MRFDVLNRDRAIELAIATDDAQRAQVDDLAAHRELDAWIGNKRPTGAGIPDADIPDRASDATVPTRDFGHLGTLAMTGSHDASASYAFRARWTSRGVPR